MNEHSVEAVLALRKLNLVCIIGELPHERIDEQAIELDIELGLGNSPSLYSDSLDDTIDYVKVADLCQRTAKEGSYHLIEALAFAIAKNLKKAYKPLWVKVAISKPRPLPHLESSAVEVYLK